MTDATFFKLRCARCQDTVVIGVSSDPEVLLCAACGIPREPDTEAPSLVPNVDCPTCGVSIALAAAETCPMCNAPFSTLQ